MGDRIISWAGMEGKGTKRSIEEVEGENQALKEKVAKLEADLKMERENQALKAELADLKAKKAAEEAAKKDHDFSLLIIFKEHLRDHCVLMVPDRLISDKNRQLLDDVVTYPFNPEEEDLATFQARYKDLVETIEEDWQRSYCSVWPNYGIDQHYIIYESVRVYCIDNWEEHLVSE